MDKSHLLKSNISCLDQLGKGFEIRLTESVQGGGAHRCRYWSFGATKVEGAPYGLPSLLSLTLGYWYIGYADNIGNVGSDDNIDSMVDISEV